MEGAAIDPRGPRRFYPGRGEFQMTSVTALDVIGAIEGTDKSSGIHDYLRHYEALFAPWKDAPITVLEIGVLGGASLRMWERFFTQARIIGADINPDVRRHATDRVTIEIGSQDDAAFLDHLCRTHAPTIIIDDGSHMAHHVIFTFEHCFRLLPPGGIYVVEDLYFHLGPQAQQYRGPSPIGPGEYFTRLAQRAAARVLMPPLAPEENREFAQYAFRHVDSLHFSGGLVTIRKKGPPADLPRMLEEAMTLAAARGTATAWYGAAGLLHRHGATEPAIAAAERAVALDPRSEHFRRLSAILVTAGRIEEARTAAARATEQAPRDPWTWHDLGLIEERLGARVAAVRALQTAQDLAPENPIFAAGLNRLGAP